MTENTITEGAPAPDFSLPSTSGETISLSDFKDKQAVVLYFYPKDSTPGCTVEACSFRDNLAAVQSYGAVVLGVSPDSVKSHASFTQKQSLNFPLLADSERELAKAYGVWVEKKQYGRVFMGIERSTFLIDKDGKIKKIWRKVTPKTHVADVMEALKNE
jgi:thioredoxin-dependent peroxiredoxin